MINNHETHLTKRGVIPVLSYKVESHLTVSPLFLAKLNFIFVDACELDPDNKFNTLQLALHFGNCPLDSLILWRSIDSVSQDSRPLLGTKILSCTSMLIVSPK